MNMIISSLLAVSLIMKVVAVLFVLCSLVLILVVLIQKGKGGGLNAALGGAMASSILGSKTGDFLTWITIALVGVFLSFAILMAKFYKPTVSEFGIEQTSQQQPTTQSPPPVSTDVNEVRIPDTNEIKDAEKTTNENQNTDIDKSTDANTTGG
ncbi:MAG: preprotein translocase subunit SecG [Planctomycetes bacterium RBG_13_46_10]|nr:MAG: preprotein translocase subunit SecG [Planctomycetes bacterium RBG_13_46_10]